MSKLLIQKGPLAGQEFLLAAGEYVIGREADCRIYLNLPGISRHHASLRFQGDSWVLEDLGSNNGTFVNGTQGDHFVLKKDALLRLGDQEIFFEAGSELASATDSFSGDLTRAILDEFGKVIIGQKEVAEQLLIALAAGGHCLMIGLPGLAKTLMVSTLAKILQLDFRRVQFTPDLMPSDIIGTDILDVEDNGKKSFRFVKGPVFTNLLLADEINRTPPKTQAALLEAMQERQVTASNQIFPLPPPFFVLATQNPLEQEGTYPLPEAQLDRFMFNILVDYPSAEEEERIIMATTGHQHSDLRKVMDGPQLLEIQQQVRDLPVSEHVVKFATHLVRMTRPADAEAPEAIRKFVHCGAGPRAAQCLILGAKARAVLQGRANVACDDVRALALPVLRHRIFTNFAADSEGLTPDKLIQDLLPLCKEQR